MFFRLCEAPAEMFDAVINSQHLLECLKQLLRLYVCTPGPHKNQDVFEAVYLLHNLGSSESAEHGVALPLSLRCVYFEILHLECCCIISPSSHLP